MAIRQPPPGIKDTNLRQFLQELRNAVNGVSDQVTKIIQTRSSSGGGGGTNPGGGGGGTDPGGGGEPPITPTIPTVVLTIDPTKPLTEENFTLTATVTGNQPTGTVLFRQNDELMTLDPVPLSGNVATVTDSAPKGTYTFIAEYSGDPRNLSAVSNALTVEIGSIWDGPPPSVTSLETESGIGYIVLKWTLPYTGDLDVIEVWSSATDDVETATMVGESNGSMFIYVPPEMGTTYYFWVRVRDAEGLFSDFYPAGGGVSGAAVSLESEIENSVLWQDLGTRLTDAEAAIEETSGIVSGPNGIAAQYMVKTDVNGLVSGFGLYNDGEVSDFFVRADRFAVGNPAVYRGGTCSIAGHTTADACTAAGGTWTWTDASTTNIPFIVYTTAQTIYAPDGSGKTLTIEPGVYMKTANIQKAFIGDAEIYGDLKSYSWAASGGPNTFPFNGWKLDKASNLTLYGGSFALYDEYGNPVIQAGKVEFNQFKRLIVSASDELFTIPKAPATVITPSSITLTAVLQNISGTVTWSVTSGTYTGTLGTGLTKAVDPALMTTAVVTFKASTTIGGIVYEDSVTLAKVQEGSDSLWLYLTNEAHLVPANDTGVVSSYTGASTNAKVYRGATDVTSSEGWTISAPTYTGCNAPLVSGTTVSLDSSHALTADVATITVRATKGSQTIDRIFTVSKAKQGVAGTAYTVVLTNESHTIPFTAGTGDYTGSGTTVLVYKGTTQLGTTAGTGNDYFSVAVTSYSGITPGSVSGATVGNHSSISEATASVTLTVTIKDSAGATLSTITKVQTLTKSENGAFVRLTTTSQVLKPKADNSDYDPRPTLDVVTANVTGTPSWQYRRTTTSGVGSWLSAGSPSLPWTLDFTPNGPTWIAATTAMEYKVTVGGVTDQITLPVVRDGANGTNGTRGSVSTYITTYSAAAAWNAIVTAAGSNPVPGDYVTDQSGLRYAYTSGGYPGTWTSGASTVLSGTVIVPGTLAANAIAAGEIGSHLIQLGAYNNDPNAIIQSRGFVSGSNGWRIRGNGDAEFNTVVVRKPSNIGSNSTIKAGTLASASKYTVTSSGQWWYPGSYYFFTPVGQTASLFVHLDMDAGNNIEEIDVYFNYYDANGTLIDTRTWSAYYKGGSSLSAKFFSCATVQRGSVTYRAYITVWAKSAVNTTATSIGDIRITLLETTG